MEEMRDEPGEECNCECAGMCWRGFIVKTPETTLGRPRSQERAIILVLADIVSGVMAQLFAHLALGMHRRHRRCEVLRNGSRQGWRPQSLVPLAPLALASDSASKSSRIMCGTGGSTSTGSQSTSEGLHASFHAGLGREVAAVMFEQGSSDVARCGDGQHLSLLSVVHRLFVRIVHRGTIHASTIRITRIQNNP